MRAITLWQPSLAYLAGVVIGDGWCTRLSLGLKVYCGRDCFCDDVCPECYRELEEAERASEAQKETPDARTP